MREQTNLPDSDADAIFIGWQENLSGDSYPLYTIIVKDHPSYLSTVSEESLRRLGLRIPLIHSLYPGIEPSPYERQIDLKKGLKQDASATMRMDTDQEYAAHSKVDRSNFPKIKDIYKIRTQIDRSVPLLHQEYPPLKNTLKQSYPPHILREGL